MRGLIVWGGADMLSVSQKRDSGFDFYKGLLILGVVLGHAATALKADSSVSAPIVLFLRTYDMPFFAFISGYFLRSSCQKRGMWENLCNKCTSILLPVLVWSAAYSLILRNPLTTIRFWFLWSVFGCSVFLILADGVTKKCRWLRPVIFAGVLVLFHLNIVPLSEEVFYGFLFFPMVVGYYYPQIRDFFRRNGRAAYWKALAVAAYIVLFCFWDGSCSIWKIGCTVLHRSAPLMIALRMVYRAAIGVLGCFVVKMLADAVYARWTTPGPSGKVPFERVRILVESFGRKTMEIYILQAMLVETLGAKAVKVVVGRLGCNPFALNGNWLGLVAAPVVAFVSVFVCYEIQKLLCRIPVIGHFLFGGTVSGWKTALAAQKKRV